MAEKCNGCGKPLSFRNSFVWENKPVCKPCLKLLEKGSNWDSLSKDIVKSDDLTKKGEIFKFKDEYRISRIIWAFIATAYLLLRLAQIQSNDIRESIGSIVAIIIVCAILWYYATRKKKSVYLGLEISNTEISKIFREQDRKQIIIRKLEEIILEENRITFKGLNTEDESTEENFSSYDFFDEEFMRLKNVIKDWPILKIQQSTT